MLRRSVPPRVVLSSEGQQKLVTFFNILMTIDRRQRSRRSRTRNISKSKEKIKYIDRGLLYSEPGFFTSFFMCNIFHQSHIN